MDVIKRSCLQFFLTEGLEYRIPNPPDTAFNLNH